MKQKAHRGRSTLAAGALAAALALAAPGGAQAAASAWSAPVAVSRTAEALNSSGAAVSSWYQQTPQNTFAAQVSSSADAENWTAPITLDQGVEIDAALAPNGDAVAVWQALSGPTSLGIRASTRTPSGAWSAPVSLAPAGQNPLVGVDNSGDAVAVWHSQNGVQTSSLRAGGAWTAPKTLDTYGYDITSLAVASNGAALIGWGPTNDGPVLAATGSVSGSWSAPTVISSGSYHMRRIDAVLSPSGAGAVTWTTSGEGETATLSSGGAWSAPANLGTSGSAQPALAADSAGDIVAAFTENGVSSQGTETYAVYTVRHPANGTWGTPVLFSQAGAEQTTDPAVAATPAGTFVASYTDTSTDIVWAAIAAPGQSFGSLTDLGTGTGSGETVLAAAGHALVTWIATGPVLLESTTTVT